MGASISIDGDEATHDRLRGVVGLVPVRGRGDARDTRRGAAPVVQHADQPALDAAPRRRSSRRSPPRGSRRGRSSSPSRWGAPPTSRRCCCSPTICSSSSRSSPRSRSACDELGVRLWPGNNIGYFGPYESLLRGYHYRGHGGSCGAGRATLGIEANGAIKGCPSLPTTPFTGGNIRDASLEGHLGDERGAPLHARSNDARPLGLLRRAATTPTSA